MGHCRSVTFIQVPQLPGLQMMLDRHLLVQHFDPGDHVGFALNRLLDPETGASLGGDEHLPVAEPYCAGDGGRGADFMRCSKSSDLEAIANQNDAERFSERYAA